MAIADSGEVHRPYRLPGTSPYAYPDWKCRPLAAFSRPLDVLLIVYAVVTLLLGLTAAYSFFDPRMFGGEELVVSDLVDGAVFSLFLSIFVGLSLIERILFFICVFLVCRFTFRAMKNLYTVGSTAPDMSPTAAVVWYFIPFAMWVMPSFGMSQIHQGSVEEAGELNRSNLVSYWWSAWVIGVIGSTLANFSFTPPETVGTVVVIAMAALCVAALLLRVLVNKIARLQEVIQHNDAAEVFA